MSTSREEIDLEKCILVFYYSSIAKFCFSYFWIEWIIRGHFFPVIWISSDEGFYISLRILHFPHYECEIGFLYSSFCDFELEGMHGFIIFCYDDEPTRIFIEAMYDTRPLYSIYDARSSLRKELSRSD